MKPALPKGTRDFLPEAVIKRQYLFGVITEVFRKYGYAPIETPAVENLSTLTGKYGEEGDRLLFKILNSGDFLSQADADALDRRDSQALISSIAKRGMRYDLTVPFARFVVMHQNELSFPFKRYQIQPVWRADRPQKGRYQEFYQCDVDVVGSGSLMYEAELIQIYDEIFEQLRLPVHIRINNRKILAGLAQFSGIPDQLTTMTIAIDKWDKIGADGVRDEMIQRDIPQHAATTILDILHSETLDALEAHLAASEQACQGITEVRQVLQFLDGLTLTNPLTFDIRLARGLDYYTGCIFEVSAEDAEMGSLGGGGRYDDLTSVFGLKGVPGVGISFGAERIYDVMEVRQLFPDSLQTAPKILFISLDEAALQYAFTIATSLRRKGVSADVYPEAVKMQKQMRYANQLNVPYVGIIGETERQGNSVMLKNMHTGDQKLVLSTQLSESLI